MGRRVKRYTRLRDNYHVICQKQLRRDPKGDFTGPAAEQLAAYEETGLTPAQVRMQQGELCCLLSERDFLHDRIKALETDIASTRSEREYFRSRAEFFCEMAICKQEGK